MSADSSFKLSLSFHWVESTWTSQRAEKYCKLWFSFQFWFQTCLVCARLFTGEIERNYGNFSLSTMNGDISLLGQNCARDDFHHISLFLDHNGRTVDTFLQEMLIDLENWCIDLILSGDNLGAKLWVFGDCFSEICCCFLLFALVGRHQRVTAVRVIGESNSNWWPLIGIIAPRRWLGTNCRQAFRPKQCWKHFHSKSPTS